MGSALWANPNQGANASLWGQPMPVAAPPSGLGYTFGPEVRVRARVRARLGLGLGLGLGLWLGLWMATWVRL